MDERVGGGHEVGRIGEVTYVREGQLVVVEEVVLPAAAAAATAVAEAPISLGRRCCELALRTSPNVLGRPVLLLRWRLHIEGDGRTPLPVGRRPPAARASLLALVVQLLLLEALRHEGLVARPSQEWLMPPV